MPHRHPAAVALALLAALVPGPLAAQGGARESLLAADRAASAAADSTPTNLARSIGTDGVLLWPGAAVVRGPAAATLLGTVPYAGIAWQRLQLRFAPDSTMAFMLGVSAMRAQGGAQTLGRYVAAWQRDSTGWRIAAIVFGTFNDTTRGGWSAALGAAELPALRATGRAAAFVRADSLFSADAATMPIGDAFAKWSTPDGMFFSGNGELNVGPVQIRRELAALANTKWNWHPVLAGSSRDGAAGWTVGEAVILFPLADGTTQSYKSKYLSLWLVGGDGAVKFWADGGNERP